jgi:hypothetical protein
VPGTKSVKLTGAEAQPHSPSTEGDEDASSPDHNPTKRKTVNSPSMSPERAHKDKRAAPGQQVIDYGKDRVVDPLGGQTQVPPQIKEATVSDWLNEQSSKCRLMYWILFDIASVLLAS